MAAISGTGGMVQFSSSTGGTPTDVLNLTQWQANIDAGLIPVNAFGSTWSKAIPGLRQGTASCQGFWEMTSGSTAQRAIQSALLASNQGEVNLLVDDANSNGYTGDCYISRMQIGAQVDNAVTVAFDITFNGAISYSTTL